MAIKIYLLPKRAPASRPPSRPRARRVRNHPKRPLSRSHLAIFTVAVAAFLLLIFLLTQLL